MDIETFREYCISKPGVSESLPFNENVLVFKVGDKIFALMDITSEIFGVNLKCDPEKAIILRDKYDSVKPGYHMNKTHWNTIVFDEYLDDKLIFEWTDDSYNLVFSNLTKKIKSEILNLKSDYE